MPAGADVLRLLPDVESMLTGAAPAAVLTPASDPRESELLTTGLRVGEPVADEIAVVVATSGTTGVPKGAQLTAAALRASAVATADRLGGPGHWLLALPAHHIAGLQVLVRSVLAGTVPVVVDVADGFDVAALPAAVDAMGRGRRYASLVAVQLAKALSDRAAAAALASLDAVLIGGGPLPAGVAGEAAGAGIRVVRTYGMSETAGGCVYDGVALPGVGVRIDDLQVLLGGPTLAAGYRNPVIPNPFAEPGWFATGDAGSLDEAGTLTVTGRIDDAISTGGLTVQPHVVEQILAGHPAVAACAVFGVPDERLGQRVAAAVVPAPGAVAPSAVELREYVAASLDPTAAPREVHVLDELPLRGIGKIDRAALARHFA